MDDSSIKANRVMLRRIQDHLHEAQSAFGVQRETISFVEVIHHPTSTLPDLNYATPRRNTAWISGKHVEQGLDRLRALKRLPRVEYIEGLFPPFFAKTLSDLGLTEECSKQMMVYVTEQHESMPAKPRNPAGIRLESDTDGSGSAWWRANWRSEGCEVMTLGVEPLGVGQEGKTQDQQSDILLYHGNTVIGAARLGVQRAGKSAHIIAVGILREARTPRLLKVLAAAALRAALTRGCTLVFAPGETESDREIYRKLGFVDVGSVVCYAARSEERNEVGEHDSLGQPVLALRR